LTANPNPESLEPTAGHELTALRNDPAKIGTVSGAPQLSPILLDGIIACWLALQSKFRKYLKNLKVYGVYEILQYLHVKQLSLFFISQISRFFSNLIDSYLQVL